MCQNCFAPYQPIIKFLFTCFACIGMSLIFVSYVDANPISDALCYVQSVTASPGAATVGSTVTVASDVVLNNDGVCWGYVDFGDGTITNYGYCVYTTGDEFTDPVNTNQYAWLLYGGLVHLPHQYASAGTYTITVLVISSTTPITSGLGDWPGGPPYYNIKTVTQFVGPAPANPPKHKLRPGECAPCGKPSPFSGNASDTTVDPVPTRGLPLGYNVTVNTQSVETNRPLGNAAFTYDMHVGTQTVYDNSANASTNWVVVDEDGRRWDFGNASATPVGEPGVFSTLTVNRSGNVITGYSLTNAGPPGSLDTAGSYAYTFNALGQMTQIKDPQGNPQNLTYTNGQLTSVVDANTQKQLTISYSGTLISQISQNQGQEVTHFSYTNGLLTSISVQNSTGTELVSKQYGYDSNGLLQYAQKDHDGNTYRKFTYSYLPSKDGVSSVPMANETDSFHAGDASKGFTQYSWGGGPASGAAETVYGMNAKGGTTEYDYNAAGDLLRETLPALAGATAPTYTSYVYNANRLATSETDGTATNTFSYNAFGELTSQTDALSNTWNWTYSGLDLLTSQDPVQLAASTNNTLSYSDSSQPHVPTEISDALSNTFSLSHNAYGQTTTITPPSGSPTGASVIAYDETVGSPTLGYAKSVTDALGDLTTFDAYDALGDLTQVSTYPINGNTTTKNTTNFAYDANQRLTQVTNPDSTTFSYNYVGRDLSSTTDEASHTYDYYFCPICGALEAISGPLGWSLNWYMDADHDITGFVDANRQTTTYTYGLGRELTKVTYPDSSSLSYLYNNAGLVRQVTNGRGQNTTLSYDAAERTHQLTFPSTGQASLTYDYNADGTVHDFVDGVGTTTYTYAPNGWVTAVKYNYGLAGLTVVQELDYTYYPNGLRHTLTWLSGPYPVGVWTYGYDAGGRLTSVGNPWGETTTYNYDGEGKLTSQTNANGTSTTYGYNQARSWVTSITQKKATTPFASYALDAYDPVGNLQHVTELDGSVAAYGYDALNRLTSESRTGTAALSHSYGYDLAGNLTTLDSTANTYDAANKQTGVSYDGDGDRTSVPQGALTWDNLCHLTNAPTTTYQYDAGGLRVVSQIVNPPTNYHGFKYYYIYDGDMLLGQVMASGRYYIQPIIYTWGAAGLVSEYCGGKRLWYHFGPQGETRQLTDSSGNIADTYNYTAYGQPVASTGADPNYFRFGGQYGYQTDLRPTGFLLCGQRWYDPNSQRWLSRDPMGYESGANLYQYCDANPTRRIDPMGTAGFDINRASCLDLCKKINEIVNEVGERLGDLRNDSNPNNKNPLYPFRNEPNPKGPGYGLNPNDPGKGSWAGHQDQLRGKQDFLKKLLKKFNDNNCSGGYNIPSDAWQWATSKIPTVPRPASAYKFDGTYYNPPILQEIWNELNSIHFKPGAPIFGPIPLPVPAL